MHTVKIIGPGGVNSSAVIDMSTGSDGTFVYVAITPVLLAINTQYSVLSEEFNGGDQWYDGSTAVTTDSAGGVVGSAAVQTGCTGTVSLFFTGSNSYVPPNFQFI